MPKDAYYIKLDTNTRSDPKVKMLEKYYGIKGFGIYISLVLLLREEENNELEYGEFTWDAFCDDYELTSEDFHKFVDDCIDKFKLFTKGDARNQK